MSKMSGEMSKNSFEELTAKLRWKDGVLQQCVKIVAYFQNGVTGAKEEWRDVPTVERSDTAEDISSRIEHRRSKSSFIPMAHENKHNDGLQCIKCGRQGVPIHVTGGHCFLCAPCPDLNVVPKGMLDENKFHCDECEDEREHYHNMTATGMEIEVSEKHEINHEQFGHAFAVNKFLEEANAKGYTLRPMGVSPSWPNDGTVIKGNRVVLDKGTEMSVGSGEIRINGGAVQSDTWLCVNHAPGSEIEVKKGEKCFCGRGEE